MKKLNFKILLGCILLATFLFSPRADAYDPSAGDLSKQSETDIRLLTYNTHRMFVADPARDGAFNRILTAIAPDVIVFEEIYWSVSAAAIQTRLEALFSEQTWHTFNGDEGGWWDGQTWVPDVRNVLASRWPLWETLTDTDPDAGVRGVTIGRVDLPDDQYAKDIYVMGLHLKSNSGGDPGDVTNRQYSCDASAAWIGDARDAKEAENDYVSLIPYTPIIVLGDCNFLPGEQPEVTLRTGQIVSQWKYGPSVKGDWDNTDLTDAVPADPWDGDTNTWPSYGNQLERFDRFYYTDCAAAISASFILNTVSMYGSPYPNVPGLQRYDTENINSSDHLPVVMDLRIVPRTSATPTPTPPSFQTPTPTPLPLDHLSNPGFESWSSSTKPENWTDGSFGKATYQQESGTVHGGSSSLQLTTTTTNTGSYGQGIYQQYIPITTGDHYCFSAYVWSEETGSMGITANWWTGSTVYWETKTSSVSQAWEKLTIGDTAPAGVQNVRVHIRGFLNSSFCGYADDTSLYLFPATPSPSPTPAPTATPLPDLLQNGNFEGWHTISEADSWKIGYSGAELRQEFTTVQSRWYSAALTTLTSAGDYGMGIYQDVAVTVGEEYAFSAWAWGTNTNSLNISFSWWNGSSNIWLSTIRNNLSQEWEELFVSGTAPSGTISARVWIRGDLDNTFCGYVDHARFYAVPTPPPTSTPTLPPPSPTPSLPPPSPTPTAAAVLTSPDRGDYDGDGTSDIAVFRPSSGLWAVRAITRLYYGSASDIPIPGDYDGDGTSEAAVYKSASGLWAVRGLTRLYFGTASDRPLPGDYNGDGACDEAVFRGTTSLWAIRGISRIYFGGSGDRPVPGDYNGDGSKGPAVFRESSGLWAIRSFSRAYFGQSGDSPVPGDFSGDGSWEIAVFRYSNGLWSIRNFTRIYFGSGEDQPVPADFSGTGASMVTIFRPAAGLWAVKNLTRAYYGSLGDLPVTR